MTAADVGWTVVFTRGDGCRELASVLDPERVAAAGQDLAAVCVEARANLLVARKSIRFDLVPTAIPTGFEPKRVASVAAAVGGGPHSRLAARVTRTLADQLAVPGRLVCVYERPNDEGRAEQALAEAGAEAPELPTHAVEADSPVELERDFDPGTLLIVGAPGGNWLQRRFFGAGARLIGHAPSGAVVVRDAPRRVFHTMRPPHWVSPDMAAVDAARVVPEPVTPVVRDGAVVGMVIEDMLHGAEQAATVADVMIDPVIVKVIDALEDLPVVPVLPAGGALPVIDRDGRLVGVIDSPLPTGGRPG